MTKKIRDFDRYTSEDTARMQAIWTGIILAIAVLVVSLLYFTGKNINMTSNTPAATATPSTTGSTAR
jgi:hypothetical protein